MGLISDRQKIGMVGIYNSGKTVFLTALINHLLHHDPDNFRIVRSSFRTALNRLPILRGRLSTGPVRIIRTQPLPLKADERPFSYDRYRDDLVRQGHWPEKTSDACHYRIQFQLSDRYLRDQRLHFYDFPGGRIESL